MSFKKLLITIIFYMGTYAPAYGMDLALLSEVKADPAKITLSDIVDNTKTDSGFVDKFGNISVKSLVTNGTISVAQILVALEKAGVDLSLVRLISPAQAAIVITNESGTLALVNKKIIEKMAKVLNQPEAELAFSATNNPSNLPDKSAFYDIAIEPKSDLQNPKDKQVFLIKFLDHNGEAKSTSILEGQLTYQKTVAVAKKNLFPGDTVTAADFNLEKRSSVDAGVISTLSDLGEGHFIIKEGLALGEPLKRSQLNVSSTMQKGALVTILTGDKHFQVRTLGRVKDVMDGGGSVLVENVDSKREILGRPVSSSEVQIVY